jgi:hypothetical protein
VTALPDDHVVTSLKEIDDGVKALKSPPQGGAIAVHITGSVDDSSRGRQVKPAVPNTKKPKGKKRKDTSPAKEKSTMSVGVEEAIAKVAGILAILPQDERFAVLKKVNGAFGFKLKATDPKTNAKGSDKKKPAQTPKTSLNEDFAKTLPGMILEETSKVMKQASLSAKEKVTGELHELHSYLLRMRAEVKNKTRDFPVAKLDPALVKATTDGLLRSHKVITAAYVEAGQEVPSPEVIFTSGLCLLQGQSTQDLPQEIGTIPPPETWAEAPRTVPRTNEEAEKRAAALLASKKQRKRRKASKPDNQAVTQKRARDDDEAAEAADSSGATPGVQAMELEATTPTEIPKAGKLPAGGNR